MEISIAHSSEGGDGPVDAGDVECPKIFLSEVRKYWSQPCLTRFRLWICDSQQIIKASCAMTHKYCHLQQVTRTSIFFHPTTDLLAFSYMKFLIRSFPTQHLLQDTLVDMRDHSQEITWHNGPKNNWISHPSPFCTEGSHSQLVLCPVSISQLIILDNEKTNLWLSFWC